MSLTKEDAIKKFSSFFDVNYVKLGFTECDYKITKIDSNVPISYVQIIIVESKIRSSYPLKISGIEFSKLISKMLNPVIIWACDDGIIYGKVKDLYGTFRGNEDDIYLFIDKQKKLKYIKY